MSVAQPCAWKNVYIATFPWDLKWLGGMPLWVPLSGASAPTKKTHSKKYTVEAMTHSWKRTCLPKTVRYLHVLALKQLLPDVWTISFISLSVLFLFSFEMFSFDLLQSCNCLFSGFISQQLCLQLSRLWWDLWDTQIRLVIYMDTLCSCKHGQDTSPKHPQVARPRHTSWHPHKGVTGSSRPASLLKCYPERVLFQSWWSL